MSAGMCQCAARGLVAIATVLLSLPVARAVSLYVPQEFGSIQAAIGAASAGDEIVVAPGTYRENLVIDKAVVVRGTQPAEATTVAATVIDGGRAGPAVTLSGCCSRTLSGLTIANGAADGGGGVLVIDGKTFLTRCIIRDNEATSEGGGILVFSNLVLEECTLFRNKAGELGGGLCDRSLGREVRLSRCAIAGNEARDGGGIWGAADSKVVVTGTIVAGNAAADRGGGIGLWNGGQVSIGNCLLAANTADRGGALAWQDSRPTVRNCTISGNLATTGGAVYAYAWSYVDDSTLVNSIVWDNSSMAGPPVVLDGLLPDVKMDTLKVAHCVMPAGGEGLAVVGGQWQVNQVDGNLDVDPLFVNAAGPDGDPADWADNDYRLSYGSPCIDAGSDSLAAAFDDQTTRSGSAETICVANVRRYAVGDWIEYDGLPRRVTDVDGAADVLAIDRPLPGASEPGRTVRSYGAGDLVGGERVRLAHVDIGARELRPAYSGDLDGSGAVTLADVMAMAEAWDSREGSQRYQPRADLELDGYVDVLDLLTLAQDWGKPAASVE